MSLYVIVLNEPSEDAWNRVRQTWPVHHVFDHRLAFIAAEDNALTADIAEQSGIGPDGANGFVVQMDFFSGHTNSSLVEWISKNRD